MTDIAIFPEDIGLILKAHRLSAKLSKKELAEQSNRVREVIYRLEDGKESTVSSLLAVTRALGLRIRFEPVGMPTMEELAERFDRDEDEDDAP